MKFDEYVQGGRLAFITIRLLILFVFAHVWHGVHHFEQAGKWRILLYMAVYMITTVLLSSLPVALAAGTKETIRNDRAG